MYDGVDRHTVLGATGDPNVPGLGFRYDTGLSISTCKYDTGGLYPILLEYPVFLKCIVLMRLKNV
jgi:hypothetical protein